MVAEIFEPETLELIAKRFGTPTYVYDFLEIKKRVETLKKSIIPDCDIYFAVKSCSNIHILEILARLGCGTDIVSGGELFRSNAAGVPASKIVFSGVGKTDKEINEALDLGISSFNVESLSELEKINLFASKKEIVQNISLRVNPNINVKTHPYISTGLSKNKFGLSEEELNVVYKDFKKFRNLRFNGLSCHIGSQLLSLKPLRDSWISMKELAAGAPFKISHLDLGGGLGVPYTKREKAVSLREYADLINKVFKKTKYHLGIEPGRSIMAPAGILLSSLTAIKRRKKRVFYIMDAGMNDLIRPALYQAIHMCEPVHSKKPSLTADIVGPVCETGDTFEISAKVPEASPGELFAFKNAGAYGMSMASQYNSRPRPAEALVLGKKIKLIRKRETYDDLIKNEIL